jgi:hypothetical protein
MIYDLRIIILVRYDMPITNKRWSWRWLIDQRWLNDDSSFPSFASLPLFSSLLSSFFSSLTFTPAIINTTHQRTRYPYIYLFPNRSPVTQRS